MTSPTPPDPGLDALLRLWTGTHARITERRSYEWKITLSLWAVQLLTAKFVIEKRDAIGLATAPGFAEGIVIAAYGIVVVLYAFFTIGWIRHNVLADRDIAIHFENEVLDRIGAEHAPPTDTRWGRWSALFQIGVTALLALGSILLALQSPTTPVQHAHPTTTSTTTARLKANTPVGGVIYGLANRVLPGKTSG